MQQEGGKGVGRFNGWPIPGRRSNSASRTLGVCHITRTGLKNVRLISEEMGIQKVLSIDSFVVEIGLSGASKNTATVTQSKRPRHNGCYDDCSLHGKQ
jgi:hypothetical protein